MSPNGRRAWRKWAKRRRRRMNAHHRALYTGAKMRKAQPVQLNMPVPMRLTPRSLVGMTQGARKRAALVDYVSDRPPSQCLPSQRREYTALAKAAMQGMGIPSGQPRRDPYYKKTCLAKYLIGQKLRPCPGCSVCARPCHYCEMQEPDDSRCPRCGQVMYSTPICDGP